MAFSGVDFLFDNQYSEGYGLKIVSINGNSTADADAGSQIEILNNSVFRKPTKYQYGVSYSEVLSFDMEVSSETPIIAINRSKIQKWLFGRMTPCKLQIIQPDLQTIYFNCFLINAKTTYIANSCYGFTFTVECDAPWGWELPKWHMCPSFTEIWKFYNDSDNTDYTCPLMEIKMNDSIMNNGNISLINQTDGNREMKFLNLNAKEVIKIDCSLQKIESSEKRLLSEFFNKKFFRMLSGLNEIKITGEIDYLKMFYSNVRKVGG